MRKRCTWPIRTARGWSWMAFPVKEDGTLGEGRVVFRRHGQLASKWNRGSADGMAIDEHGNVWATAPGGVAVLSPEGKHLGSLITTQRTANCKFGEDGSTLFIAADDYFLRIRTDHQGHRFLTLAKEWETSGVRCRDQGDV